VPLLLYANRAEAALISTASPWTSQNESSRVTRQSAASEDTPSSRCNAQNRDGRIFVLTEHGDLRVPHFFGLHAMQILPLIAWLWKPKRANAMIAAGGAYALLFVLTLAQALAGRPFLGGLR
jgi:hypothetical protein